MGLENVDILSLSVLGSSISRRQLGLQPFLTKSWHRTADLGVQVVRPWFRSLLQSNGKFLGFPSRQEIRTVVKSVGLLRNRWKSEKKAFLKALNRL